MLAASLALALVAAPLPNAASTRVAQTPVATKLIGGFRSAQFGMTPADVRRAAERDFPGVALTERSQPSEGTTVTELVVPLLDPGPGPAIVSYVFGATSHRLAQISVSWATKADATADERQALAIAGLRLSDYFRSAAPPRTVLAPKVVRPGSVSLYGAIDRVGAGVELTVTGFPYASTTSPMVPPTGPASLRLTYMANPANPDILAPDGRH